jgi:ribosome biogenesis GTPase
MGANIDRLFVITSIDANLNPSAIDRMLLAGKVQGIPTTLVANKSDLGVSVADPFFAVYRNIGIDVLTCSAKADHGLDSLRDILARPDMRVVALCGVSGVGKSTILNRLVPGAKARTGEVSERTGQGRQTTSQPRGFLYTADETKPRIVIDFPGVQFFGLSHVPPTAIADGFDEFHERKDACRFVNCRHLKEPDCAVVAAVELGEIAPWRYSSYLGILDEIEEARKY